VISNSVRYYNEHFHSLPISFVLADAVTFLRNTDETYDLICVDLFDDTGYASCMSSPVFYTLLRSRLKPGAIISINCAGVPIYLDSFAPGSPLAPLLHVLQNVSFSNFYTLPYRRNTTLIISEMPILGACSSMPPTANLKPSDRIALRVCHLRSQSLSKVKPTPPKHTKINLSFATIDRYVRTKWRNYLAQLTDIHQKFQTSRAGKTSAAIDLLSTLRNRDSGESFVRWTLRHFPESASFFPAYLSAKTAEGDSLHASWLADFVEDSIFTKKFSQSKSFILHYLTQACAIRLLTYANLSKLTRYDAICNEFKPIAQ
jgi:hypothetical protein